MAKGGSRLKVSGVRGALASLVMVCALGLLLPSLSGAADDCELSANKPASKGKKVKPPVTLTAEPTTEIVNFGTKRGTKSFYVALRASRPLPGILKPDQLEIAVPLPPRRVSDTLESATLDFPRFSKPRFINGRREVQFRVCVDASDAEAGTYTVSVQVVG